MAFELGVDYGGPLYNYSVGDCQLQVSSNQVDCDGIGANLDLYTRNIIFDPRSALVQHFLHYFRKFHTGFSAPYHPSRAVRHTLTNCPRFVGC